MTFPLPSFVRLGLFYLPTWRMAACFFVCFTWINTLAYAGEKDLKPTKSLSLTGINLSARVLLQGAYVADTGLMRDDLRTLNLLPVNQPFSAAPFNYTGTEQLASGVLAVAGQDAVVDWLLLELRETVVPFSVVAQQAVILQRDGDVVDPQTGDIVVNFPTIPAGNYRISVRHRNHLGVLSANTLNLEASVTLVDFSSPLTPVMGHDTRIAEGGFVLLRGGNSNQDSQLIVSGTRNDSNPVLGAVLLAEGNPGFNSSYRLAGYAATDLNMDGETIYVGPNNDTNLVLFNVLTHPLNHGFSNNFIVTAGVEL